MWITATRGTKVIKVLASVLSSRALARHDAEPHAGSPQGHVGGPTRNTPRVISGRSGAPRGALLYPRRSREELGGRFLGPMAYLDPKGEGDQSMPGK